MPPLMSKPPAVKVTTWSAPRELSTKDMLDSLINALHRQADAYKKQGSETPVLVASSPRLMSAQQRDSLHDAIQRMAGEDFKVIVLDAGVECTLHPTGLGELVAAINTQSDAIDRLVTINQQLIQAMAESDGEESIPATYLDGTPVR